MDMLFGLQNDRLQRMTAAMARITAIDEVVIFGSRALGNYKPTSDIDIAVKGTQLSRTDIMTLFGALDDLPYGYTYDIVDYNKIVHPELKAHIDEFGVSFYKRTSEKAN